MQLPRGIDPHELDTEYRLAPALWAPAVVEVCERHGWSSAPIVAFEDGSNLVAAVGARVVKIFPPFHRHQWESERRVLPVLHGALPVPVPALLAEGERDDGWTYVVVERLAGESLETAWAGYDLAQRASLMREIGEAMRAAHALPVGALVDLPPRWDAFFPAQIAGCRARHARLGAPEWVLRELDAFVPDALAALPLDAPHVILTGEYTPFNLLAERDARGPRLSGMIDFGDAMVGPREYDLLGPSVFLGGGEPRLVRALFEGYGLAWPLDRALRRGLLALLLIHRYSRLDAQVRLPGWSTRARSLDELAVLLWPEG